MVRRKRSSKSKTSKSVKDSVNAGLEYFNNQKYSEASKSFGKALKKQKNPDIEALMAESCFRNALSMYKTGKLNYIISELHRAIQNNPKPIYYYHLGLAYHRKGRTDKSIPFYLKALEEDEENDRFKFHLALAYLEQDNVQEANDILEKISDSDKYKVNNISEQMLALTLIKQGNYKEALETLKENNDRYANFFKGVAYIYLGKNREAKSSLRKSIAEGFDDSSAHYHLGVAYTVSDNKFSAVKSWETAIKNEPAITEIVKPELMNVYRELAAEYVLEKDALPKAVTIWRKMLKLEPKNIIARNNLVRFYFLEANEYIEDGDIKRATNCWKDIIELEPENSDALHNLALAYDRMSDIYTAISFWEKVIKVWEKELKIAQSEERTQIKKQLAVTYRHLGYSCLELDQINNAIKNFQKVTSYDAEDVSTITQLAELYAYTNRFRDAIREIKNALEIKPQDMELHDMLAMLYVENGKNKLAIDALLEAHKLEPDNKIIREKLSQYTSDYVGELMELGKELSAYRVLKNVIECMPDEAKLHVLLGGVYLDDGKSVEAEECFQNAIDIDANDGYTYAIIGKFYLRMSQKRIAKSFFKKAMDYANGDASVPIEISRCYCFINDSKQAQKYFDLAIEYEPTEETFVNIIMILTETGLAELADKYVQKGIKILSQSVSLLVLATIIAFQNQDNNKVEEYLELATKLAYESEDPRLIHMVQDIKFSINMALSNFGDMFVPDFDDEWLEDEDEWLEDDDEWLEDDDEWLEDDDEDERRWF